jgi:SAM-dependent methyltransferase
MSEVRDEVRRRYAAAAIAVDDATAGAGCGCGREAGCGCDDACCSDGAAVFGPALYEALESERLPDAAVLASLGCGNPLAVADLHEGETVLDLGSGGGIDVLLSATRVGPSGRVYGLDMTDEMLALAGRNLDDAGATNVVLLKGFIEEIPLPASSVDVVISNCVINLSVDKPKVFREMHRVLRAGGRIGITDVVAANDLTEAERAERGSHTGCIAGALSFEEYERGLADAGFRDVEVTPTHGVADRMFSAIVKATKGEGPSVGVRTELPLARSASATCC